MDREGRGDVATAVMIAIRAPHGRDSQRIKVIKSHRTPLEAVLLTLAWLGFFIPLIWIASPAFSFAEYPLRIVPLIAGIVAFVIGLWLFYRSHADLGTNWSITLECARSIDSSHRGSTGGFDTRCTPRWCSMESPMRSSSRIGWRVRRT